MVKLELNKEEFSILADLIDVAVKSIGAAACVNTAPIIVKLNEASKGFEED